MCPTYCNISVRQCIRCSAIPRHMESLSRSSRLLSDIMTLVWVVVKVFSHRKAQCTLEINQIIVNKTGFKMRLYHDAYCLAFPCSIVDSSFSKGLIYSRGNRSKVIRTVSSLTVFNTAFNMLRV